MSFKNLFFLAVLTAVISSQIVANGTVDHSLFDAVLKKYVKNGLVNYAALKNDRSFDDYLKLLSNETPSSIKDEDARLVFWINAYNAFTLKLIIDHYPLKSIRDISKDGKGPWDIVWIKIGGKSYSLNQIEHEIIRKEFDEPLIHMALVCAAVSCPPLRAEAYSPETLEAQFKDNTKVFFKDPSKNKYDKSSNIMYLSELLNWYGSDFDKRYGSAKTFGMVQLGIDPKAEPALKYLPYDWSLNEQR